MKVTYNWLKDFLEISIPAEALADKMTMAGLEVTSLTCRGGDFVFEIEVTSNRPDCLSVIGLAREVAVITGKRIKDKRARRHNMKIGGSAQPLKIKIEDKKDCCLYTAKIIRDVRVGPSPKWLKERLELVGIHSVNNIVDATNYVLFEEGEPLHAFDLDKLLPGTIWVRRGRQGEKIVTIDGQERLLGEEILVIADSRRPVALAGIMGSKDTEVTEHTKDILLEAALFNPIVVRRGRQSLGVQSEAAYRFERGVALESVEAASLKALNLINQLAGGHCVSHQASARPKGNKKVVSLGLKRLDSVLGVVVPLSKTKSILSGLGFQVKQKGSRLAVAVPGFRQDISSDVDLVEEVGRIFGYKNIPATYAEVLPQPGVSFERTGVLLLKRILVSLGLQEVVTLSLIDKTMNRAYACIEDTRSVEIANPLSSEQEVLRRSLVPSLLKCVALNLNQKQRYINIFEISKDFFWLKDNPVERLALGLAFCGDRDFLLEQGCIRDKAGPLHLKGVLETVFKRWGIKEYGFKEEGPGCFAVNIAQEKIGFLADLSQDILQQAGIKNRRVVAAEIYLEKIINFANLQKRFIPLALYPGISRDISLVIEERVAAGDIIKAVQNEAHPLLEDVAIVDCYRGKQIPSGFRGLTLSCFYRTDERTLTEEEINPLHLKVCTALKEQFKAEIR
ncbi:MAG: phenylalanine--tRNA ligase subunit beta [Candidatus Omnitrophota bacterium]